MADWLTQNKPNQITAYYTIAHHTHSTIPYMSTPYLTKAHHTHSDLPGGRYDVEELVFLHHVVGEVLEEVEHPVPPRACTMEEEEEEEQVVEELEEEVEEEVEVK